MGLFLFFALISTCFATIHHHGFPVGSDHLMEIVQRELDNTKFPEPKKIKLRQHLMKLNETVAELEVLYKQSEALAQDRALLKTDLLWFLDSKKRTSNDHLGLELKRIRRDMENHLDQASLEWSEVKPLFGIRSDLFIADALQVFPATINNLKALVVAYSEFGIILSIIFFGPFALGAIWSWGISLWLALPLLAGLAVIVSLVQFAILFPVLCLEFDPTPAEFFGLMGTVFLLVAYVFKLSFKLLYL